MVMKGMDGMGEGGGAGGGGGGVGGPRPGGGDGSETSWLGIFVIALGRTARVIYATVVSATSSSTRQTLVC